MADFGWMPRKAPLGVRVASSDLGSAHVTAHKSGRVSGPHQKLSRMPVNFQVPAFPRNFDSPTTSRISATRPSQWPRFRECILSRCYFRNFDPRPPICSNRRSVAARKIVGEGKVLLGRDTGLLGTWQQTERRRNRELATAVEKSWSKFAFNSEHLLTCSLQAWCPRWQAQDDPGSPSVRAIPSLTTKTDTDRPSNPESRTCLRTRRLTEDNTVVPS